MEIKELELNGLDYLKSDEYKNFIKVNKEQEKIRQYFVKDRFTLEFIRNMYIDDYVEGKNETYKNSFCYLLEFGMHELGSIRGSFVTKFGIYYNSKTDSYEFKSKKFGSNSIEVFECIRNEIINIIKAGANDDFENLEKNKIAPMFKGKIHYVYYPEKSMPIYSIQHLDYFLNVLDVKFDVKTNAFEKRRALCDWKMQSEVFKNFSNVEFMQFLYSSYGFKTETDVLKNHEEVIVNNVKVIINPELIDREIKKSTKANRVINFEEVNRKKTAVGIIGEDFVLKYEKQNNKEYRNRIINVSDDNTLGYDILSFDENGNEKHIEVKTVSNSSANNVDFYLTYREKNKLDNDDKFYIYYVCGLRAKKRKLYIITKKNLSDVTFEPIAYKITAKNKQIS